MAFPLAIIESVKKTVADHAKSPFIVGYRLSPEERENPRITMFGELFLKSECIERRDRSVSSSKNISFNF